MGISPITLFILVATVATSIAAFYDRGLYAKLSFDPYLIKHRNQWYRFITGALVHANWLHLLFNMWALYIFGSSAEKHVYPALFGEKSQLFYIILYVGGIVLSSTYTYEKHKNNPHYSAVGASGAVSAVIMPFALAFPLERLFFFFIPMPSALFAVLYLVMSWYLAKREDQGIAHDVHFWGAIYGIVFTLLMNKIVDGPSLITHFLSELGIYL